MDSGQLNRQLQNSQGDASNSTDLSSLTWESTTTKDQMNLVTSPHLLNSDGNGTVQVNPPTAAIQGHDKVSYYKPRPNDNILFLLSRARVLSTRISFKNAFVCIWKLVLYFYNVHS